MSILEERHRSWQTAAWLFAIVPTAVWWIERILATPHSGWFSGATTFAIGGDFRTFHTAASLAVNGEASILYDPAAFQAALGPEIAAYGPLGNPPPLVVLLAPLGWLSFELAWLVFAALSIIGIAVAFGALGVERRVVATVATLLFPPVYYALTFGQLSVLWLVILAGVYALLRNGRLVLAGSLAGLLVMKPTLAFGLALWWLIDWRPYRTAAFAALGTAIGALGVSFLVLPESWTGYVDSLVAFIELRDTVATQWAQFSVWTFWDLLIPGSRSLAAALGFVSFLLVVAWAVALLRRSRTLEQKVSIAVLVTMLAVPHLLAYDWTLLLIPGVLLWDRSPRYMLTAAAVTGAAAWSIILTNAMLDGPGFALQIAPLVLLGSAWFLFHDPTRKSGPSDLAREL